MSKKRSRTTEQNTGIAAGRVIFGGIAGVILTVILTFFASWAVSNEWIPLSFCGWLGPVILVISAFFASLMAAGRNGKKLICGLLCAGFLGSLLLICGLLLFSSPMRPGRLALSVGALLVGTLGGVLLSGLRN